MRLGALLIAALALPLLVLAPATPAAADTSDFTFDSFDAEYRLVVDDEGRASMTVVETIVARFPDFDQNRGIIRAIPLRDGEVDLNVTMLSVTDENGVPVYYERDDYDGFAEFALGTDEYVQGPTTYVLEYTMRDPVRAFETSTGADEFYWDVNGTGWGQSFGRVSARIVLDDTLRAALTGDASCYAGYYGDTTQCALEHDGGGVFEVSVEDMYPYASLTVAIGFESGTVVQPELPRDSWIVRLAPQMLFWLQVALLVVALVIKRFVWRDARGRGTIIAQYTPPEDSTMLLGANVVGRTSAALPALFVDLAVRGILKVIDTAPGAPAGADTKRFSLELVTTEGLHARELKVISILFGSKAIPGERVNPGSLSAAMGASLYELPASTAVDALTEQLRAAPKSALPTILRRAAWFVVLAFVLIWVWAIFFEVLEGGVVLPSIGSFILAIAISAVISPPARLTERGAELRDHLLGLREYLTVAEQDRMRMLQSPEGAMRVDVTDRDAVVKLNERLLGYAVLWGVEDRWVEVLRAQYPAGTPAWLEGGTLSTAMFHDFTTSATSSVRPIVTSSSSGGGSSWSSSGGSSFSGGSSGGGFSGGGGGGGGGGGR